MKGNESFRKKSKALLQSSNEVFVYSTIIPHFSKVTSDQWIAEVYFADCGSFSQLGSGQETILALSDLSALNFRMSSDKIDLDANHLRVMARKIASYHAVSFAMRVRQDPMLENLIDGLIPFHIQSETQGDLEPYKYLCPISFERIFEHVSATSKHQSSKSFMEDLNRFKITLSTDFLGLMEGFLRTDNHQFAAILHGDYYRNNVMFKYENCDGSEAPVDLRMFDFQEVRYASVVIDLSIFMYMHVHASLKPVIWDELLEFYHETLIDSLTGLLKCEKNDARLEPYSIKNFLDHFKKFAFYGVCVSIHSIPWMASAEEETQKISDFFEKDMHHPEFKKLLKVCGGVDVSERIVDNVKHASEKGYMKIF